MALFWDNESGGRERQRAPHAFPKLVAVQYTAQSQTVRYRPADSGSAGGRNMPIFPRRCHRPTSDFKRIEIENIRMSPKSASADFGLIKCAKSSARNRNHPISRGMTGLMDLGSKASAFRAAFLDRRPSPRGGLPLRLIRPAPSGAIPPS
jgi:hypothetical protein